MLPKRISTGIRYKSASELNCVITFMQSTPAATDGTPGALAPVWTTHANIASWRGKEEDLKQVRDASSTFKITMRYSPIFIPTADMIIQYHDQTYNIETISDIDGQRIQLELWCWIENTGT
jgi:head-tail adaptor